MHRPVSGQAYVRSADGIFHIKPSQTGCGPKTCIATKQKATAKVALLREYLLYQDIVLVALQGFEPRTCGL